MREERAKKRAAKIEERRKRREEEASEFLPSSYLYLCFLLSHFLVDLDMVLPPG